MQDWGGIGVVGVVMIVSVLQHRRGDARGGGPPQLAPNPTSPSRYAGRPWKFMKGWGGGEGVISGWLCVPLRTVLLLLVQVVRMVRVDRLRLLLQDSGGEVVVLNGMEVVGSPSIVVTSSPWGK